jgi:Cupin
MTVVTSLLLDSALRRVADGNATSCISPATFVRFLCRLTPAWNDCAAGLLARASRLVIVLARSSGSLASASRTCRANIAIVLPRFMPMSTDTLSEVFSAAHLTGSVIFDVVAKSPWVAEAPPAAQIANEVTPGAQRVIEHHVVTRGSCWLSLVGNIAFEPTERTGGDMALIPHGDAHVVSSAPGMRAEPDLQVSLSKIQTRTYR